jgi:hypothetical protein
MARENLSDAVICVGQQGHQSADAKGKKRAAQVQHARSDEASEAQHSVEKGNNREAGGSEDEALPTGAKQSSILGVSRTDGCAPTSSTMRPDACRPSSENGKTIKRQRRLNEIFTPATNKGEPEKHQTNEPRDSKLVLKTQTKRDDTTHSSWVCNDA